MRARGFGYENDKSRVRLVDTKGNVLTKEVFYLLRCYWWDIKNNEVQLIRDERTNDLMAARTDFAKDFLMTNERDYCYELFVSADLKAEIETKFKNPMLFTLKEWDELNSNDWDF